MNKINIFFDASVFIVGFSNNKNMLRGGVYFVAWNVLINMCQNENFHITLAYPAQYKNTVSLKKIIMDPFFSRFEFVCVGATSVIPQTIESHKKNKNYMKMCYNYLRLAKLKLTEKIYSNNNCLEKLQIYLSPYHPIPQNILGQKHIKAFYILHDTTPIIFPENVGTNATYKQMLNTLNKNTYSFCVSKSSKDDFLKYCGDRLDPNKMFVTHIATSYDYAPIYNKQVLTQVLKRYNVEHNPKDKYIFSLCNLEPRKNLPFTIAVFLKFIKKHNVQDLYFYLGGGAWKSFDSVMARTLEDVGDFKHKIKLLGYVDDTDVNILYSNSLFFVYLSQYEGFGMPPLEAMQAGTPVITSNNSSLPEVVGDAAITVTYDDEQAVIKAFEDFYFNEDLRNEYIAKGLERAKMFSWDKCVGKMIGIMNSAIGGEYEERIV